MNESPAADKPGLRERKKARTRATIQEHALRLFREQGYDATTVEQIAEAAEVSPSTFFRYFGSKEEVVTYDSFDPILIAAWRAQPPELGPIAAIRKALRESFASVDGHVIDEMMDRGRLLYSVPDLRSAAISEMIRSGQVMIDELALRTGRSPDDPELRFFVGGMAGVMMAAVLPVLEDPTQDIIALVDRALAYLEKGMPV